MVVVGSGEFLNDVVFEISGNFSRDSALRSLQFMQNAVDWSVEDLDLLSIRSRGTSVRVLYPISDQAQRWWELGNYVIALIALISVGGLWLYRSRNEEPMKLLHTCNNSQGILLPTVFPLT